MNKMHLHIMIRIVAIIVFIRLVIQVGAYHDQSGNEFLCSDNIPRKNLPSKPRKCKVDSRVKTSGCYWCNQKCKNFGDLKKMMLEDDRLVCDNTPIQINCCILAQILNKQNHSSGGVYGCYGTDISTVPKLDCPFGTTGSNCAEQYTETVKCQCYAGNLKILQHLIDCNDEHKEPSWSNCKMHVQSSDVTYTCSCKKTTEHEVVNTQRCSADNGSQSQLSCYIVIWIVPVVTMLIFKQKVTN